MSLHSVSKICSGLSILVHVVISLQDMTSYDKSQQKLFVPHKYSILSGSATFAIFYPDLIVLVQPRKTCPNMTEKLLTRG